jgi:hypothetical protein
MPYNFKIDDKVRRIGDKAIWIVNRVENGGLHYGLVQQSGTNISLLDMVAENELVHALNPLVN